MKNHPWFWGTLAFWIFLAGTATAWALIWGTGRSTGRLVGSFEAQVQGEPVQTEVREYQEQLSDLRSSLENSWKGEGWIELDGDGSRLIAALTGTYWNSPITDDCLSSFLDLKVFNRGRDYRFLGLLQREDGNLWTLQTDLPGLVLGSLGSTASVPRSDLPKEVVDSYESESGPFKARVWRVSTPVGEDGWLEQWCSRQGIRLSPGSWHGSERFYWAKEKSRVWVIRRSPEAGGSTLAWGSIR